MAGRRGLPGQTKRSALVGRFDEWAGRFFGGPAGITAG